MGTWALLQVVLNIFAALGFFVILMRMSRQPKDDPRLSRGLQLLQSKIAVLEDLSDRSEMQVNQLTALLDQKSKEVHAKVQLAERTVHEIRVSMERSLEVAKIFQDKIPHREIIERQSTMKYVQAARLAHQGVSVEEIASRVDLPKGEIEFIAKVNREQLMFNEDQLPAWAQGKDNVDLSVPAEPRVPPIESQSLFNSTSQLLSQEDQAARLRAEMEIAESQRLVENLSRLQFEMQNLDMQLTREPARGFMAKEQAREQDAAILTVSASAAGAAVAAAPLRATARPNIAIPQSVDQSPVINARSAAGRLGASAGVSSSDKIIRKVQFPRIESFE